MLHLELKSRRERARRKHALLKLRFNKNADYLAKKLDIDPDDIKQSYRHNKGTLILKKENLEDNDLACKVSLAGATILLPYTIYAIAVLAASTGSQENIAASVPWISAAITVASALSFKHSKDNIDTIKTEIKDHIKNTPSL